MQCPNCSNIVVDTASFCNRCGTKLQNRENHAEQRQETQRQAYQQAEVPRNESRYDAFKQRKPVSVWGWIGRSLIMFIPVIGFLIYLIMLLVWSGDYTKEETFRNWAKAQLVVMFIFLCLVLVAMGILFVYGMDFIKTVAQIIVTLS